MSIDNCPHGWFSRKEVRVDALIGGLVGWYSRRESSGWLPLGGLYPGEDVGGGPPDPSRSPGTLQGRFAAKTGEGRGQKERGEALRVGKAKTNPVLYPNREVFKSVKCAPGCNSCPKRGVQFPQTRKCVQGILKCHMPL